MRLDQHVVGLRDTDAELVHADRLNVASVGGHHGHVEAGDAHVEQGHRRGVDDAQAHALAALEQPQPAVGRRDAVHQEGVGVAGHVRDVAIRHAHLVPHGPAGQEAVPALLADLAECLSHRAFAEVVVVGMLLQLGIDVPRVLVGPVRQQHYVIAVVAERLGFLRFDDDGTVGPGLLLETRVAVVPEGAALPHREAVGVALAGPDTREAVADVGHAVLAARQDDAVPVDRAVFGEVVGHPEGDRIPFAPAQHRRGHRAVDGGRVALSPGEVDPGRAVTQLEAVAAQHRRAGTCRPGCGSAKDRQANAEQTAGSGQALHEAAASK